MSQTMRGLQPGAPDSDLLWPTVWMTTGSGPQLITHREHFKRLKLEGFHEISGPDAAPAPPDALAAALAEIERLKVQLAATQATQPEQEKEHGKAH